jgi:hypothetical protein
MSILHPAASRPGNRGRLILRMLLDGAPSGLRPIATADTATIDTLLLAADSPELGENGPARPYIALGLSVAVRPLAPPAQN